MFKKAFLIVIIVTALFSSQLSWSEGVKSEEKIIANSPDSLKEFLLKTINGFIDYDSAFPYPQNKGESETTQEFNLRIADWKAKAGVDTFILYKATGLFPVLLGVYNSDKQEFYEMELRLAYLRALDEQSVSILNRGGLFDEKDTRPFAHRGSLGTPRKLYGGGDQKTSTSFKVQWINCPIGTARALQNQSENLRCDIVFSLDYVRADASQTHRHLVWFAVQEIKFYLPEIGEIIFQASVEK